MLVIAGDIFTLLVSKLVIVSSQVCFLSYILLAYDALDNTQKSD